MTFTSFTSVDTLKEALDRIGRPQITSVAMLVDQFPDDHPIREINHAHFRRRHTAMFAAAGYIRVPNPWSTDKRWLIDGRRQVLYATTDIPAHERLRIVERFALERAGRPAKTLTLRLDDDVTPAELDGLRSYLRACLETYVTANRIARLEMPRRGSAKAS